jgi:hypothetical protein
VQQLQQLVASKLQQHAAAGGASGRGT